MDILFNCLVYLRKAILFVLKKKELRNVKYVIIVKNLMKLNFGDNFNTCRIYYNITKYPKYLFILFDLRSYHQLKLHYNFIKKLLAKDISFTNRDQYKLKGCVTVPGNNHFTFFINNLDIKDKPNALEKNKNYYFDDMKFNHLFLEIENLEDLICENDDYFIVPYLAIYEKLNI